MILNIFKIYCLGEVNARLELMIKLKVKFPVRLDFIHLVRYSSESSFAIR